MRAILKTEVIIPPAGNCLRPIRYPVGTHLTVKKDVDESGWFIAWNKRISPTTEFWLTEDEFDVLKEAQ